MFVLFILNPVILSDYTLFVTLQFFIFFSSNIGLVSLVCLLTKINCSENFCAQTDKEEMNSSTSGASTNSTTPFLLTDDLQISLVFVNFLFVLPTNSYVLWLIIRGNGIVSEIFNFSLSMCEIVSCFDSLLFSIPNSLSSLLMLSQFLQGFSITGRPLFQCLMCVERYLAVVHPVTFLKYKPLRYRVICCSVAWMVTLGSCLSCLVILIFSTYQVNAWFFMLQLVIFFFIELLCAFAVLRALKQSGPGERRREREEENNTKRRAFTFILISTVTTVTLYAPYTIITFVTFLMQQDDPVLWIISCICYVLVSFIHAVLYLHRAKKTALHQFTIKPVIVMDLPAFF